MITVTAYANCGVNACDGVGGAVVRSVMPFSNGQVYLEAPATAGNLNCTLFGGNKMVIKADNPNKNLYVASLLTGIALGNNIRVRIVEGSSDCEVAYVWVRSW